VLAAAAASISWGALGLWAWRTTKGSMGIAAAIIPYFFFFFLDNEQGS
jgi:hypothetical protein